MIDPSRIFNPEDDYMYGSQCVDEGATAQGNECEQQESESYSKESNASTNQYRKEKEQQFSGKESDQTPNYDIVAAVIDEVFSTDCEEDTFTCKMGDNFTIEHIVKSTNEECGIYVTIFEGNKQLSSNLLANRASAVMAGLNLNREKMALVRSSPVGKEAPPLDGDLQVVIMPCSAYIKFLEFLNCKWPNLCSRLSKRCQEDAESDVSVFDPRYKRRKYEKGLNVYISCGGPIAHNYVVCQTNRNQILRLETEGVPSRGNPPVLTANLYWSEEALGKVSLSLKALKTLGLDYEIIQGLVAARETGAGDERAEIIVGGNKQQINFPQQPVQQHLLQQYNQTQPHAAPFQQRNQVRAPQSRLLPPETSLVRVSGGHPPPPRRPRTPGKNIPIPSSLTSSSAAAKKRRPV